MNEVCCCVLGHRDINVTNLLKDRIKETVILLITKYGVTNFLFGSRSVFDKVCYEIISEVKRDYPYIRRIYVRAEYSLTKSFYENYLKKYYEESFFYCENEYGRLNYIKRNESLINLSEYCLFFYNDKYIPKTQTKSGTHLAYLYAVSKKKKIINLFQYDEIYL